MWLNQAPVHSKARKSQTKRQSQDLYGLVDALNNPEISELSSSPPLSTLSTSSTTLGSSVNASNVPHKSMPIVGGRNTSIAAVGAASSSHQSLTNISSNKDQHTFHSSNRKRHSTSGSILQRRHQHNSSENLSSNLSNLSKSLADSANSLPSLQYQNEQNVIPHNETNQNDKSLSGLNSKSTVGRSLTLPSKMLESVVEKAIVTEDDGKYSCSSSSSTSSEYHDPELFLTLAVPNGNETTLVMSEIYDSDHKSLLHDAFSNTIQSAIYDLIEGSMDIPEDLQATLHDELNRSRFRLTYKDYGKHILCSARNGGRYFERCLERKEVPHLFVHFSTAIVPDTEL